MSAQTPTAPEPTIAPEPAQLSGPAPGPAPSANKTKSAPVATLSNALGAASHVATLLAWIYLYLVAMLGAWIVIVMLATGWQPVALTSGSMAPTLRPGDVILLDEHPDELVGQRSVITFESSRGDGELITHRVFEVLADQGLYITQGDANTTPDTDKVHPDQVQGVGRLVVPMLGLPIVWAQEGNAPALIALVVMSAAAFAMAARSSLQSRRRKDTNFGRASELAGTAIRRVRVLVALMIAAQFFVDSGRFEVAAFGLSRVQLLVIAIVGLGVTNAVSLKARDLDSKAASRVSIAELAADTALVVLLSTSTGGSGIGWVLVALPIIEAAVRFRLAGALVHWMMMASVTLATQLWILERGDAGITVMIDQLEQTLDQLGVLLLVAIPGAYLAEQLVTDVANQQQATAAAVERGKLLEHVAHVGHEVNRLGTELFSTLTESVVGLGFDVSDVSMRLPNQTWKILAKHAVGPEISLPEPGTAGSTLREVDLALTEVAVDQDDPDLAEFVPLTKQNLRAVLRITLSANDATVIALRAGITQGEVPHASAIDALRLLCGQATVALQNNQLMGQLHDLHEELAHQANHDPLTGLPNRARFLTELQKALQRATNPKRRHVVMFMDLNGFKQVNDTLGHDAGDVLLQEVSSRLTEAVGDAGLVARLGGDEFTVLLNPVENPEAALSFASRLHAHLEEPFLKDLNPARVGISIGIAYPQPGVDASELLRRADAAMYAAKSGGGSSRTAVYHPRMDEGDRRRGRLASEFKKALEHGGLSLAFQPIISTRDGSIAGAEALIRWTHRELGAVNTATILELAEVSDRVTELNRWIFSTALAEIQGCNLMAHSAFFVALNVSPAELASAHTSTNLSDALLMSGLPPNRVVVELSEQIVAIGTQQDSRIDAIAALGVRLSLDDFGQGQTSLAHLNGLPISQLKLDRMLIAQAAESEADRIILESVTTLAQDLSHEVVVEGIEDERQRAIAAEAGADLLQGYGLYRPMPIEDLRTLLVRAGLVVSDVSTLSEQTPDSDQTIEASSAQKVDA